MDELIQLIVFLLFFLVWVFNAVAQAKKRRRQELEEGFEEFEEFDEEEEVAPTRPLPLETVQPARSGWEEIQRELRRMLEEKPSQQGPAEQPPVRRPEPIPIPIPSPPPPPRPQTVSAPAPPRRTEEPRRAVPLPLPSRFPTRGVPTQVRTPSKGVRKVHPSDRPAALRPTASPIKRSQKTPKADVRSLVFHPDPLANAIILSEIVKPYSGPRPYAHRR